MLPNPEEADHYNLANQLVNIIVNFFLLTNLLLTTEALNSWLLYNLSEMRQAVIFNLYLKSTKPQDYPLFDGHADRIDI